MGVVEGRKFGLLDCYAGTKFHYAFQCIDEKTDRIEWFHVHFHLFLLFGGQIVMENWKY